MSDRIRVLSVIGDLGFGGAEHRLLSLACNIDRTRFDHTLLILNDPRRSCVPGAYSILQTFHSAGLEVLQLPESGTGKCSGFAGRMRTFCNFIRQRGIDLIDAHSESAALLGATARLLMRTPCVATLYHPHPLCPPRFWTLAEQLMLANIDLVITDSAVRGHEIQQVAWFRQPEFVVIPNGALRPAAARVADIIRRQFSLPRGTTVVGQISALRPFKGQMVLLDAARLVLEENRDLIFLILGYEKESPGFQASLKRRAAELRISEKVRIVGYPGLIGDVWNVIDIHVHASLFDSLPNAILEGMSLGKPAVVTAVGGIPDAVKQGETGLVVPPGDPAPLASALLTVLRDSKFAVKLGQSALERYEQCYRPELAARSIESCFIEVLKKCSVRTRFSKNFANAQSL